MRAKTGELADALLVAVKRRGCWALILVITGSACAGRLQRSHEPTGQLWFSRSSPLEPAFEVEARAHTHAAGSLIVLDPGLERLRALDPETGAPRWELRVHEQPQGEHMLTAVGERVLSYSGDRLAIADARRGVLVHDAPAPYAWSGRSACHLEVDAHACAFVCECSLSVFECETGVELGTYLAAELGFGDEGYSCYAGPDFVGAALTVVAERDEQGLALMGIDASGTERWRREGVIPSESLSYSTRAELGRSPDGELAWLIERKGLIEVFSAATGEVWWREASELLPRW